MAEYPDLSPQSFSFAAAPGAARAELRALAVGFLGNALPRTGTLGVDHRAALQHLACHHAHPGEHGYRACALCGSIMGRGKFVLEHDGARYVSPALMLHYIDAHSYLPPERYLTVLGAYWSARGTATCRANACGPRVEPSILPASTSFGDPGWLRGVLRRFARRS